MPMILARVRLALIYALLLLPVILFGAWGALKSSDSSPLSWVSPNFPPRQQYDDFVRQFGTGDAVIASWPECTWDNRRLDRLVRVFRESKLFRSPEGFPCLLSVVSGRETVLRMTAESEPESGMFPRELGIPLSAAVKRLRGTLIGPDGRTTCLILNLSSAGLKRRADVVRLIRRSIMSGCGVAENDIHLAGPVIDGYSVDAASQRSLASFVGPSAFLIFLVCWMSLRSFPGAVLVFLVAVFCQAATLAVIYYSGQTMSALLIVLPPLIQVLTISGGIHLMNYYFDSLEEHGPRQAAIEAFRRGWLPCSLSAGTTAMGTASLLVSGLTPIRLFAVYATVGVIFSAVSVLVVIPCGLILFPVYRRNHSRTGSIGAPSGNSADVFAPGEDPGDGEQRLSAGQQQDLWLKLRNLLHDRNPMILAVAVLCMVIASLGLPLVHASVRIETLFPANSRVLSDYQWLEAHVGRLVPMEVLVRFDRTCALDDCERLQLLKQIEAQLETLPAIGATTSARTFFPPLPSMKDHDERERRRILNRAIASARPAFVELAVLRTNSEADVWRITAHSSALAPLDYGALLDDIDRMVNRVLRDRRKTAAGVSCTASGVMPLVHEIQKRLLSDLFESLLSAGVVIAITMTLAEAGFINGLVSMLPNAFPIVMLFGLMGWLRLPMDIGSIMTASVALGIAVDDTLHYLTFFRRSMASGRPRHDAVLWAYRHCGPAMIQTSATCGVGLLIFALSDFLPTSRFALMMAGLLFLALVGDLVILPALLLSPLGKFFERLPETAVDGTPATAVHGTPAVAATPKPGREPELTPARQPAAVPI